MINKDNPTSNSNKSPFFFTPSDGFIAFLNQNQNVDFKICNLQDKEIVDNLNFDNINKNKKQELIVTAMAYQRLLRIVPEQNKDAALILMKEGIHSALQISSMTRKEFMQKAMKLFRDNGKLARKIYENALEKKSAILIQYMDILQNKEPHISTARFD